MKRQQGLILLLLGLMTLPSWFASAQDLKDADKKVREGAERREIVEKHRDELKGLSPEERQAKIRELSKKEAQAKSKGMTPEERDAKRKEMRERMQKQLSDLRQKKADGTLNATEKKRLERMEEVARRMDQNQAGSTNKVTRDDKGRLEK
jgi:biopolymer transport protein ExbB/TolQ